MKRSLSVICLFIATLFWIAITVIPHHHHNGVLIFISDSSHSDCHHSPCNDSDNDKCCNNNNCEECPFSENSDSIIKKAYDDSNSEVKFPQIDFFDIYNYKYDFISQQSIRLYYTDVIFNLSPHTQCSLLRAPPMA